MTSELSSWIFSIGLSLSGSTSRPSRPRGQRLLGLIARAQAKTWGSSASTQLNLVLRLDFARKLECCRCRVRSRGPRPARAGRREVADDALHVRLEPSDIATDPRAPSPRALHPARNCERPASARAACPLPGTDPSTNRTARTSAGYCGGPRSSGTRSMRLRKPAWSCFHSRSWRNTRIVFMPSFRPSPSSVSMRIGSNVSGLPHFEFVDRGRRDVVRADQPGLLRVPVVSGLFRPPGLAGTEIRPARGQKSQVSFSPIIT